MGLPVVTVDKTDVGWVLRVVTVDKFDVCLVLSVVEACDDKIFWVLLGVAVDDDPVTIVLDIVVGNDDVSGLAVLTVPSEDLVDIMLVGNEEVSYFVVDCFVVDIEGGIGVVLVVLVVEDVVVLVDDVGTTPIQNKRREGINFAIVKITQSE